MSVFGVPIKLTNYFDERHFDTEEYSPTLEVVAPLRYSEIMNE